MREPNLFRVLPVSSPTGPVRRTTIAWMIDGVAQGESAPPDGDVIRVVVADDHPMLLDALRGVLTTAPDFRVVGEARTGRQAVEVGRRTRADLLLVDLRLPDGDGFWVLQALRDEGQARGIILSANEGPAAARQAAELGALGYLSKRIAPQDLPAVVRQVWHGGIVPPALTAGPTHAGPPITDRELQILRLVADGRSNVEIGRELWVVEQTVKFHLAKAYRKLGVTNRTEAMRVAHERGLLTD